MKRFLIKNNGTTVLFEVIEKVFNKNTPQYSINLISGVLNDKKLIDMRWRFSE